MHRESSSCPGIGMGMAYSWLKSGDVAQQREAGLWGAL